MPNYNLTCGTCGRTRRRILVRPFKQLSETEQSAFLQCNNGCEKLMTFGDPSPTAQVMEELDNGAMSRKVVRHADAERLWADRAAKDPRK
jgi:hypothetical protein